MVKDKTNIAMAELKSDVKHISKMQDELKLEFKESKLATDTKLDKIITILQDHMKDENAEKKKDKEALNNKLESLDKKYAPAWVEKVMIGAGSVIGFGILGALLSLILK
jgi:ABC-type phosphate transport system auxiliary subunit